MVWVLPGAQHHVPYWRCQRCADLCLQRLSRDAAAVTGRVFELLHAACVCGLWALLLVLTGWVRHCGAAQAGNRIGWSAFTTVHHSRMCAGEGRSLYLVC